MSYTPQAGTFPARVIDYLRSLPGGTERSSSELAEALDQDRTVVANLLQYARTCGALKARRQGMVLYWSLGDGEPEPLPHDYEPDEPLHKAMAGLVAPKPAVNSYTVSPDFRAALWTNGTLQIESDGKLVLLTRDEANQLRELLRGGA